MYSFIFEPSYNERGTTSYFTQQGGETYTLKADDYIPTFIVETTYIDDTGQMTPTYNDRTYFDISFY